VQQDSCSKIIRVETTGWFISNDPTALHHPQETANPVSVNKVQKPFQVAARKQFSLQIL
jgi:hypothetical protein